jgi:hypothetical protein
MTTVRSLTTAIERGMKTLDARTDSRTKLNWWLSKKKLKK